MTYDRQLAIRMTQETRLKLEQRARKESRPVTQMARLIIENALKKEKLNAG